MLSPGQIHALKTNTKVDGQEASSTYMQSVRKTVKLKIYEACDGLHQVYRDFPEFQDQIRASLSWVNGGEGKPVTAIADTKKSTVPSNWPTLEELENAPPLVIDEDRKAKLFRDLDLNRE